VIRPVTSVFDKRGLCAYFEVESLRRKFSGRLKISHFAAFLHKATAVTCKIEIPAKFQVSKPFQVFLFIVPVLIFGCTIQDSNPPHAIHDTVYVVKKLSDNQTSDPQLIGSTILKASEKNMEARWVHGLWLDDFTSTECLEAQSESPSPTEITSVKYPNDST
jgi:hypothetical protein